MRRYKYTFIFFLNIIPLILHAQIDSLLSYYPMAVGNMWQYKLLHYRYSSPITEQYYTITIQGDTVINGKVYQIFSSTLSSDEYMGIYPRYERIDTMAMVVYGYDTSGSGEEYFMDSLSLGNGSPRFRFANYYNYANLAYQFQTEFGELRNVRILRFLGINDFADPYSTINECRDIGITWSESGAKSGGGFSLFDYWFRDSLVYAKINSKEFGTLVNVKQELSSPGSSTLKQNYPNPFNPTTTIQFYIQKSDFVELTVFDIQGRLVSKLVNDYLIAGHHSILFDATNISSGVYYYRIKTRDILLTRKMVVIK